MTRSEQLFSFITRAESDGYDVRGFRDRVTESLDNAVALLRDLSHAPIRADWPYVEPDTLDEILAECDPSRVTKVDPEQAKERIRAAFLGSVCGCMLGKPVEFNPTLADLEALLTPIGEWPLNAYISSAASPGIQKHLGWVMGYWHQIYRDQMSFVMPDDDLNYSVLGMLLLEAHGADLTTEKVREAWSAHLPGGSTFGPEAMRIGEIALRRECGNNPYFDDAFVLLCGTSLRGGRHCGAQIRADAYGYACPGDPALAARLAYHDASLTHRGTGLYATMWTAAAIATAQGAPTDPLDVFRIANRHIPQRSRFHEDMVRAIDIVAQARDWRAGYEAIRAEWGTVKGSHCAVVEESATLINTLRFARRVDDGICIQVMQGNDTDSYGATAGSLLGAYLGPGLLDHTKWVAPFNDRLCLSLAWFYEPSLSAVAERMADLPRRLSQGDKTGTTYPVLTK